MIRPGAYAGHLEGNPVREDIEETAAYCPADFIVNVVLDDHKKIAYAAAGDPVAAHRDACRFLDGLYRVDIKKPADVVIVSTGGYPKDINLYQAQKSIDNAKHAVKEGGIMIVAASCHEATAARPSPAGSRAIRHRKNASRPFTSTSSSAVTNRRHSALCSRNVPSIS